MPDFSTTPLATEANAAAGPFDVVALAPNRRNALVDEFARMVVRRRLETPAIFFLEMHKPLCSLASTAVTFAKPTFGAFFGFRRMAEWAALLDDRENIERLIRRIEELAPGQREGP